MATRSEQVWLVLIAGENRKIREALSLEMHFLKAKLDGPSSDLLDCMLVDRIVMSMLQCAYLDISFSEWESCDRRLAAHARHRPESAHRGLLVAIMAHVKALAGCTPETTSLKAQRSAKRARRANSEVWRFDNDVERFLRIAGPGEYVPPSEPDSALSMSYRQRISGFDMQAYAEHVWINRIAGQDEEHKEQLKAHISALKAELLERAPSFVERLLVDRVVICQLQRLFAGSILQKTVRFSDDQATHARKCMDSAHRRERAATRTLAAVRNLLRLSSSSVKTRRLSPGLKQ